MEARSNGAPDLGKQVTQWTLQLHDVTVVQQLCHDRVQVAIVILQAKKLLASLQAFLELAGPVFQLEGAEAAYTDQQLETTRAALLDSKVLTRSDAHLFLGVKSPNSKDKSGTGAVNAFKIYYT